MSRFGISPYVAGGNATYINRGYAYQTTPTPASQFNGSRSGYMPMPAQQQAPATAAPAAAPMIPQPPMHSANFLASVRQNNATDLAHNRSMGAALAAGVPANQARVAAMTAGDAAGEAARNEGAPTYVLAGGSGRSGGGLIPVPPGSNVMAAGGGATNPNAAAMTARSTAFRNYFSGGMGLKPEDALRGANEDVGFMPPPPAQGQGAQTQQVMASPPAPTQHGTAADMNLSREQARAMWGVIRQQSPDANQWAPQFAQKMAHYGVGEDQALGLLHDWSEQDTLLQDQFPQGPGGTKSIPASPVALIPPGQGKGGVVAMPNGQQLVVDGNGQRVGDPIGQGAPLAPHMIPVPPEMGPERGYTPINQAAPNPSIASTARMVSRVADQQNVRTPGGPTPLPWRSNVPPAQTAVAGAQQTGTTVAAGGAASPQQAAAPQAGGTVYTNAQGVRIRWNGQAWEQVH